MAWSPRYTSKVDRLQARLYRQELKANRAEARRAAKADRIAAGIKGAPIADWEQPPVAAGIVHSLGVNR